MCDLKGEFNKSLKSSSLWTVLISSHHSVFLFSLLSEWIILFSHSLVQINGDLHMGPHKPPRSSSSLCHCHGDSSERPRYMTRLVWDTQRFLVVPQAHMDTYTDSTSINEMKEILLSPDSPALCLLSFHLIPIFTVQRLFSWLSGRPRVTDSFIFPQRLVSNSFQTS